VEYAYAQAGCSAAALLQSYFVQLQKLTVWLNRSTMEMSQRFGIAVSASSVAKVVIHG